MKKVFLKKGREKSLLRFHPWVFSGAVEHMDDDIEIGETIEIYSNDKKLLGIGAYSPHSQIRLRVWSFDKSVIDENFFKTKIEGAVSFRKSIIDETKYNSYLIINSESDGIPGLIVDKYDDILVCQFVSAGAERWKQKITEILIDELDPRAIYERSDAEVRNKEGLKPASGLLFGKLDEFEIKIMENNISFYVNIQTGHKTGFYLDQRVNRKILQLYSQNKSVLNCFSYTGGFGVSAAAAGADYVTNLDTSEEALQIASRNFELNKIPPEKFTNKKTDVFKELRSLKIDNHKFDLIILDPPKFVEGKNSLNKAARGYKDINMLAMQLLKNDGVLFTFSCSGLMTPELFNKIIADAAVDAKINASVVERLWQSPDHRVSTNFPESLYLKGLILKRE
jgi:23S rRNA (cytosine1962-C5)-methyltransferase